MIEGVCLYDGGLQYVFYIEMERNMNLEEIYFITQIGVGIAIIISILFVALELRQTLGVSGRQESGNLLTLFDS